MVKVEVDPELAYIIEQMREDDMTNRAIRNYARAFLGYEDEDWAERYKKRYGG